MFHERHVLIVVSTEYILHNCLDYLITIVIETLLVKMVQRDKELL